MRSSVRYVELRPAPFPIIGAPGAALVHRHRGFDRWAVDFEATVSPYDQPKPPPPTRHAASA